MKQLSLYKKLNLKNEGEVFKFLMDSLRESIFTWDFFVDWKKIANKIEEFETELNILNTLVGKKNSENKFIQLLENFPRTKRVLPLLIAVRINKLQNLPIADNRNIHDLRAELKKDYFNVKGGINEKTGIELKRFYTESGLKNLLENKNIKNLVDYYTGVEVGMDTNARKNRVGDIMEGIVENYLSATFSSRKDVDFISQANSKKIGEKWGLDVQMDKTNRRFDFAICNKDTKALFLTETNFYSGGGTKLKATAGEYNQLGSFLKQQGLTLIWITDGLGWHTAINPLRETFRNNDFVFNLNLVKKGTLKELILK